MNFSCLQTTTTFNASLIQKTWALGTSDELKNCQDITSKLIIDRTKLMKLLMPCFDTFSGVLRRRDPISREHEDPISIAIFVGKGSRLSVSDLSISFSLHQVFICGTIVLPQLHQFWDTFQSELVDKDPYTTSIRDMRMRLSELQNDDKEAMKLRSKGLLEDWEDIK